MSFGNIKHWQAQQFFFNPIVYIYKYLCRFRIYLAGTLQIVFIVTLFESSTNWQMKLCFIAFSWKLVYWKLTKDKGELVKSTFASVATKKQRLHKRQIFLLFVSAMWWFQNKTEKSWRWWDSKYNTARRDNSWRPRFLWCNRCSFWRSYRQGVTPSPYMIAHLELRALVFERRNSSIESSSLIEERNNNTKIHWGKFGWEVHPACMYVC